MVGINQAGKRPRRSIQALQIGWRRCAISKKLLGCWNMKNKTTGASTANSGLTHDGHDRVSCSTLIPWECSGRPLSANCKFNRCWAARRSSCPRRHAKAWALLFMVNPAAGTLAQGFDIQMQLNQCFCQQVRLGCRFGFPAPSCPKSPPYKCQG